MSSEEEKESLICPYCNKELVDDENQLNECSHLYSVQDDFVDWGDDYNSIIEINQIIENYVFDASENELKDFTKGLKIDKYLSVNDDWDDFTIEESIESLIKFYLSNRNQRFVNENRELFAPFFYI